MAVKIASTCLIVPHHNHSSLASAVSSPSLNCRSRGAGDGLVCFYVQKLSRSALFGAPAMSLRRSMSLRSRVIQRGRCNASLAAFEFSNKDFSRNIQELALIFQLSDDVSANTDLTESHDLNSEESFDDLNDVSSTMRYLKSDYNPPWPSDWQRRAEIVPEASIIERKANSVELPLSLRIIKRKLQWQQDGYFRDIGESAYCSMRKVFSSIEGPRWGE